MEKNDAIFFVACYKIDSIFLRDTSIIEEDCHEVFMDDFLCKKYGGIDRLLFRLFRA